MLKIKLLYAAAFFFMSFAASFAQDEPKPPVFVVSFSNPSPKTGDIIEVILTADIPAGLHMYSTYNKCDIGPLKLDIVFAKNKSFSLVGVPYSVGDKKTNDEIFKCELGQFEKKAEVRQKIKVLGQAVTINGTIEGQWCTETTCYNFGSLVPLSFNSSLKASAASTSKPASGTKKTKSLDEAGIFLKPKD